MDRRNVSPAPARPQDQRHILDVPLDELLADCRARFAECRAQYPPQPSPAPATVAPSVNVPDGLLEEAIRDKRTPQLVMWCITAVVQAETGRRHPYKRDVIKYAVKLGLWKRPRATEILREGGYWTIFVDCDGRKRVRRTGWRAWGGDLHTIPIDRLGADACVAAVVGKRRKIAHKTLREHFGISWRKVNRAEKAGALRVKRGLTDLSTAIAPAQDSYHIAQVIGGIAPGKTCVKQRQSSSYTSRWTEQSKRHSPRTQRGGRNGPCDRAADRVRIYFPSVEAWRSYRGRKGGTASGVGVGINVAIIAPTEEGGEPFAITDVGHVITDRNAGFRDLPCAVTSGPRSPAPSMATVPRTKWK